MSSVIKIKYPMPYAEPISLALGFFDGIHIGHRAVVMAARGSGECRAATLFCGTKTRHANIFDIPERIKRLGGIGVQAVIEIDFDSALANLTPEQFVDSLVACYNITTIACGQDFRFGKDCVGDADTLTRLCNKYKIPVSVVPMIEGVSGTNIAEQLQNGDIGKANDLLTTNYAVYGKVIRGRQVGRTMGIPTANIVQPNSCAILKAGVYGGKAIVGGVTYKAVVNVGTRPTFDDDTSLIETHIIDFAGDIYDADIRVIFEQRIRDVVRFGSQAELIAQIKSDIQKVKI